MVGLDHRRQLRHLAHQQEGSVVQHQQQADLVRQHQVLQQHQPLQLPQALEGRKHLQILYSQKFKRTRMKTIILSAAFALGFAATTPVFAEVKEVCKDKVDKAGNPVKDKSGKTKQDCKKIKIHKKLEGTPVPEKK